MNLVQSQGINFTNKSEDRNKNHRLQRVRVKVFTRVILKTVRFIFCTQSIFSSRSIIIRGIRKICSLNSSFQLGYSRVFLGSSSESEAFRTISDSTHLEIYDISLATRRGVLLPSWLPGLMSWRLRRGTRDIPNTVLTLA